MSKLFTIGYSSYDREGFVKVLIQHGISALVDVRSSPYSSFKPYFNMDPLKQYLTQNTAISYVFLGEYLGARTDNASCYVSNRVDFRKLARTEKFQLGLTRIKQGLDRGYVIGLMCAEKDPIACHRTILICREMAQANVAISHILSNGDLELHGELEKRLMKQYSLEQMSFLNTHEERLAEAYRLHGNRISFRTGASDLDAAE